MKIKTWIKYEEAYLPPRCRKNRYRPCEEYVYISLAEVSMKDLKLAFEDTSYDGKGKIYYCAANGKLWRKAKMRDICVDGEDEYGYRTPLEAKVWWNAHGSRFFAFDFDREDCGVDTSRAATIEKAQKDIDSYLLVDGELYTETNVPYYVIMTFGFGNNHGGTGLLVNYGMHEMDFDALHGKEAVEEAKRIATNRGDTKDVPRFHEMITVYMPELVIPKPKKKIPVEIVKMPGYKPIEMFREGMSVCFNGNFSLPGQKRFLSIDEAEAYMDGIRWAIEYYGGQVQEEEKEID